jgi:RNA 2',3'-cyclic 3'-phosphodiesterase
MARNRAARPEAAPLRLFAAVDLPPRVREEIERAIDPWRERLPGGRWVKPENWHVTVKFLGRTYPRLVDRVHQACGRAATEIRPFRVGVEGMGVFPGPGRARVLWVGLVDRDESLPALARALDDRLADDFPPEKRGFTPHLTVARFNPPVGVREHVEGLAGTRFEVVPFRVGELVLYRSHLSPRGARYEPLERFPLRG